MPVLEILARLSFVSKRTAIHQNLYRHTPCSQILSREERLTSTKFLKKTASHWLRMHRPWKSRSSCQSECIRSRKWPYCSSQPSSSLDSQEHQQAHIFWRTQMKMHWIKSPNIVSFTFNMILKRLTDLSSVTSRCGHLVQNRPIQWVATERKHIPTGCRPRSWRCLGGSWSRLWVIPLISLIHH